MQMNHRLAKNTVVAGEISIWFRSSLKSGDPLPSDAILYDLAQGLKVHLNRANNAEEKRQTGSTKNPKDVSPGALLEERTAAIVMPVNDYRNYAGEILPTPEGDVDLQELNELLRRVSSIRTGGEQSKKRGHPPKPWKQAAQQFSRSVRNALIQAGYVGPLSLTTPSTPVVITARAISWAYGRAITPEGLLSALRKRDRRKNRPAHDTVG
jgi:hypothetical protein